MDIFLEARNLGYQRRGRRVLENLNFQVPSGATALLGHNGAGKSTLLSLLATALKPSSGSLTIHTGQKQVGSRRQTKDYRRHLALVPQRYTPLPGLTVAEHIRYVSWLGGSSSRTATQRLPEALEATGLEDLKDRRAKELSGGETQRLAIAGAYATGAPLLLLDEPTAGLDPTHRQQINLLIQELANQRTLLVATHDLSDLRSVYQYVLALNRGSLAYSGTTRDFLAPFTGRQPALAAFHHYMGS